MATHSKTRTAVQRLRRAARRRHAREIWRARQGAARPDDPGEGRRPAASGSKGEAAEVPRG